MSKLFAPFVLGTLVATSGCGGASPPPTEPTEPAPPDPVGEPTTEPQASEPAPTEAPAPPDAWSADLSKEQKQAFMQAHVVPKMGAVFKSMSAERYAEFGCGTCHGPEWKLPKDYLPELTMKDGKFTAMKDKAQVVEFMMTKVVPEMASILGQQPFDPKTNTGFGCAGCHTVKM